MLELHLSLLHSSHLLWVELILDNSAWQVVGGEKNVNIVSIEDSWQVLVQLIKIHIWADWKSLDEEHGILKSIDVWFLLGLPNNSDNLLESGWNKSKVWYDSNWDWCRGVNEECDWASLAWVRKSELGDQRTIHVLELEFVTRIDVNKV